MNARALFSSSAALLAALVPSIQASEEGASLSVRMTPGEAGREATAVVRGPANARFVIMAEADIAPGRATCVTVGRLDATGRAAYSFEVPFELTRLGANLRMQGIYAGSGGFRARTNEAELDCSALLNERLSFDWAMDAATVQPGEIVSNQWAEVGMSVRAENFAAGPNMAVAFDSSNPTGNDPDLATPGPGTDNDLPYGNVLIVAEDAIDADGDGLVDDPDDERGGGMLVFEWEQGVLMNSVTLVDVDTADPAGAEVRTLYDGVEVESFFVPPMDDNSVQTVFLNVEVRVDELQVEFSGSGAVAEVNFMPCPVMLTFDTSTTGIPLGFQRGEIVVDQWATEGVVVSGVTNLPEHPDAVVVFDTSDPTGGDSDLVTPGYGPGNDRARGQVLVLADDVTDSNGDGLVDDPGDSEGGGTFTFEFQACTTLESATVLDIDTAEPDCFFEAFDIDGVSLGIFPLAQVGDNSIQTIDFGGLALVRRLELTLCSSGALVDLVYCPTPGADGDG